MLEIRELTRRVGVKDHVKNGASGYHLLNGAKPESHTRGNNLKICTKKRSLKSVVAVAVCLVVTIGFIACKKSVTEVFLDKVILMLVEGETETLVATVLPDNASNRNVVWTSSNPAVATVNNGLVSALTEGATIITVTTQDGNHTASCAVTVAKAIPVISVKLNKTTLTLMDGCKDTLIAIIFPDDASNKNVTWTSSNTNVATVSNGIITALKAGTAKIIVTTRDGNKSDTCALIVSPSAEPEMVLVDGGTFTMGCTSEQGSDCEKIENPAHQVTLSGFKISKYVITRRQWNLVMNNDTSGGNIPVYGISWEQIHFFITRLNNLTGKQYRLPTEAEWEYAARGGNKSKGYKYSGSDNLDAIAWYVDNSGGQIHPVGTKQPNELGIYDMSGNISEWVEDGYGSYSVESQTNPQGTSSSYKVIRNGSYLSVAKTCRVTVRTSMNQSSVTGTGWSGSGFRLVHP